MAIIIRDAIHPIMLNKNVYHWCQNLGAVQFHPVGGGRGDKAPKNLN